MNTLYVREAQGYREASADDVFACAQALMALRFRRGAPVLQAPAQTREFLRMHLSQREKRSVRADSAEQPAALDLCAARRFMEALDFNGARAR